MKESAGTVSYIEGVKEHLTLHFGSFIVPAKLTLNAAFGICLLVIPTQKAGLEVHVLILVPQLGV